VPSRPAVLSFLTILFSPWDKGSPLIMCARGRRAAPEKKRAGTFEQEASAYGLADRHPSGARQPITRACALARPPLSLCHPCLAGCAHSRSPDAALAVRAPIGLWALPPLHGCELLSSSTLTHSLLLKLEDLAVD
jgi:hypothetical protein